MLDKEASQGHPGEPTQPGQPSGPILNHKTTTRGGQPGPHGSTTGHICTLKARKAVNVIFGNSTLEGRIYTMGSYQTAKSMLKRFGGAANTRGAPPHAHSLARHVMGGKRTDSYTEPTPEEWGSGPCLILADGGKQCLTLEKSEHCYSPIKSFLGRDDTSAATSLITAQAVFWPMLGLTSFTALLPRATVLDGQ